ncbi:RNA-directed DNA polymerase, eukaryota, reverse transcriptase zinc-binding domain protein [Tanacetum coccineum]
MSILVNGSPSEEFGLERGIRQGDPLSPFIFILAAKGLNAIVTEAVEKGIFRGVVVSANKVMVSHLQYADDTIFFGEWSKENAKVIMCILKCFEEVFGLKANYNKSRIYGVGVNEEDMTDMARWIGCGINELDGLGLDFSSSCLRVLGDGRDIRFWIDRWVDNRRLCDRLPRFYHLDRKKEGYIPDKGSWVNGGWRWEWDWVRSIRGRVSKEFEELLSVMQNIVVHSNCRDKWFWSLDEDGVFTVKMLARLVDERILHVKSGGRETIWNYLVPKKVNIFIWRALKGRLPVREELDRRGIDLDSVLCPCCNNIVETCAHSLVTCDLTSVWDKIFNWWKVACVNAFSIKEFFSSNGGVNMATALSHVWQAVIWTSGYFIWKERNARAFEKKVSSTNKLVQDIQLKSFEWTVRRSIKYKDLDWQQWLQEPLKMRIQMLEAHSRQVYSSGVFWSFRHSISAGVFLSFQKCQVTQRWRASGALWGPI